MIKKSSKIKKGFSLIEVLVTLFVLSAGITGVSVLMIGNITTSETSRNQIIASNLAQEGVELVKNLKDNNQASVNLVAGSYANRRIDNTMSALDGGADKKLYTDGNFYTHVSTGTATKYFRNVSLVIVGVAPLRTTTVTVNVSWNGTGIPLVCNIANKCVSVQAVFPDAN